MKIRFDSHQDYQLHAVSAVVEVFDGQPLAQGQYEIFLSGETSDLFSELGIGNFLRISDAKLLQNVQEVQRRNNVPVAQHLDGRNFSIEMETGTGKTYVYLRTIFELYQRYGFTKFIVVVPSVAIREGVLKNIELTREHFAGIYGNVPLEAWVYDSKQVSRLRQFASSNGLQVLIINIDAFNKPDNNVIHRESDRLSGYKPIEFIQATNPIVVMDEPQNMESEQARTAIERLNPLCTLRYSATHRNTYNLLYRLDPVRAYDLKLVKRIEVDAVIDAPDFNKPFIHLKAVSATKTKVTAKLEIDIEGKKGPQRKTINISTSGIDLFELSNERATYHGYIVDEVDAGHGFVAFTNGIKLYQGDTHGGRTEDVMRVQIRETVKEHFEKELNVQRKLQKGERIKVLSLFFIDRVANYVDNDGKIRKWFIEAYDEMAARPQYASLQLPGVESVHGGYFANVKGIAKDTKGDSKADDEAYALIMRDKERLLSPDEPLRFIFSHSALREGWDNPNVFQICTLNETKSEIKKRQEIGRGLRLPVLESGERCFDPTINRLTIVANESYEDFARKLQTEIEEECGVKFDGERLKNKKDRRKLGLRKGWHLDSSFVELWERIKHKTRYAVDFTSSVIIDSAAERIRRMPEIEPPKIVTQRARIDVTTKGLEHTMLAVRENEAPHSLNALPDLVGYLQRETELTRSTLGEILVSSGRLEDAVVNPQQFLDFVLRAVRDALNQVIIDGIKYEKIAGQEYEMLLFEEREIIGYLANLVEVKRSIYDAIEVDSQVERRFALALDARDDIKLFIKLPAWFKVDTPVGTYNPDWAIVKQPDGEEARLYLVRETKSTKDQLKLRGVEWAKIQCGKAHFDELGVDFKPVTSPDEV
ncbi:MAG: DEAD/DEAH box helicase family protein [Polyangiaceae bacterium]|nr:DEAD/DEAH box helicase family protein [Polyangiaceae bacterium]